MGFGVLGNDNLAATGPVVAAQKRAEGDYWVEPVPRFLDAVRYAVRVSQGVIGLRSSIPQPHA